METNGGQFFFVGPHSASSQTSARQTQHLSSFVVTLCVWLALSSMNHSSVLGMAHSTCDNFKEKVGDVDPARERLHQGT